MFVQILLMTKTGVFAVSGLSYSLHGFFLFFFSFFSRYQYVTETKLSIW